MIQCGTFVVLMNTLELHLTSNLCCLLVSFLSMHVLLLIMLLIWLLYCARDSAGFYFIPDALSKAQQLHWTIECLTSFPQPPNRTNHNALYGPIANLWSAFQEGKVLVERHHTSPSSFSETDNCESTNRQRGGELADSLEDPLREDKSCSSINNEGMLTVIFFRTNAYDIVI